LAIKPIFVFSITRSGSTFLQRVVAAHEGVATVSEPWLLLPQLYARRRQGVVAEYTHPLLVTALEDFCKQLPAGDEDYTEELRRFALRLYSKAAGPQARYFLDKSPPYYFVAEEIMDLFPEGKFIFLWRNPLSIAASIIETWLRGRWRPALFPPDLFVGLPRLIATYRANGSQAHAVRFEDLLGEDDSSWRALMDYLELEFDHDALSSFSAVPLNGRMGDPNQTGGYAGVSSEPAYKWAQTIANPLRVSWCRRYLRFLGSERLAVMGYDEDELLHDLALQPLSMDSMGSDIGRLVSDVVREPARIRIRRHGVGGPNVLRALIQPEAER
jgi:hypothetical protein